MKKNMLVSRIAWHRYYAKLYDKTNRETAEHLACWYYLLAIALD